MKEFATILPQNSNIKFLSISPEQAAEINKAQKSADRQRRINAAHAIRESEKIYINR